MKTYAHVVVPEETPYVYVGVEIEDVFHRFCLVFMRTNHFWGFTLVDPKGNSINSKLLYYGNDRPTEIRFIYENRDFELQVSDSSCEFTVVLRGD